MIVFLLLVVGLLDAASFDCKKATTKIEKAICLDDELSKSDERLSYIYKEVLRNSRENRLSKQDSKQLLRFFTTKQRAWIRTRDKYCNNYTSDELKRCLKHHYKFQTDKLKPLIEDGGFLYSNYKSMVYKYTHKPYLEFAFREVLGKDIKSLKKVKQQLSKWEDGYKVCKDKYGSMDEACILKVAKKQREYYNNLLKKYKSQKCIFEEGEEIYLEQTSKSFMTKYDDMCCEYNYYTPKMLSKLLHSKNEIETKQIEFEDIDKTKPCDKQKVRFNSTLEQTIVFINQNIFTLKTEEYSYTGGLHGDFATSYDNIDRHSGKRVFWEDIFAKNKRPLYRYIVDNMKQIVGFAEFISYSDDKLYDMAKTAGMAIVDDGIKIIFGLYSISGYADGEPTFVIPLKMIKKVIPKEKYIYYFDNKDINIEACF